MEPKFGWCKVCGHEWVAIRRLFEADAPCCICRNCGSDSLYSRTMAKPKYKIHREDTENYNDYVPAWVSNPLPRPAVIRGDCKQ